MVVQCVVVTPRQVSHSPHPGADSVVPAVAGGANIVHVVHDICSSTKSLRLSNTVSSGSITFQAHTALTVHTVHICLCLKQAACLAHNDGEPVAAALKAVPRCVKIAKGPASKAGSSVQDSGSRVAHCPGQSLATLLALAAGPATWHAGCCMQALVAGLCSMRAASLPEQCRCCSACRAPWKLTGGSTKALTSLLPVWVAYDLCIPRGPAVCQPNVTGLECPPHLLKEKPCPARCAKSQMIEWPFTTHVQHPCGQTGSSTHIT